MLQASHVPVSVSWRAVNHIFSSANGCVSCRAWLVARARQQASLSSSIAYGPRSRETICVNLRNLWISSTAKPSRVIQKAAGH